MVKHKHKVVFTIATLALFLSACSTLQKLSDDDPNNDIPIIIAIQAATIKVIENGDPQERAFRIIEILDETASFISLTQEVKVQQVAQHIKSQIDYTKLDTADQLIVNALIDAIAGRLVAEFESQEIIDQNALVSMERIYQIVRNTAQDYLTE